MSLGESMNAFDEEVLVAMVSFALLCGGSNLQDVQGRIRAHQGCFASACKVQSLISKISLLPKAVSLSPSTASVLGIVSIKVQKSNERPGSPRSR